MESKNDINVDNNNNIDNNNNNINVDNTNNTNNTNNEHQEVIDAIIDSGWTVQDVLLDYSKNLDNRMVYVDSIAKLFQVSASKLVKFIKNNANEQEQAVRNATTAIFGRPLGLAIVSSPTSSNASPKNSALDLRSIENAYGELNENSIYSKSSANGNGTRSRGRHRAISIDLPDDDDDSLEAEMYGHRVAHLSPIAKNKKHMFSAPKAKNKKVPGQVSNKDNRKDYHALSAKDSFEITRTLISEHNTFSTNRIDMIAANACISMYVRSAMASTLPNSYTAGKFSDRVYGGCSFVDMIEREAILAANQLYKFPYVYVNFLSGMQANAAAFHALLKPGMRVMSAQAKHGGHYSHSINGAMRFYQCDVVPVPFDEERYDIDYDNLEKVMKSYDRVDLMIVGWSEFIFPHDLKRLRKITKKFGTKIMYDMSHVAGLIAGGVFQSPDDIAQYCDVLTSSTGKSLHCVDHGMLMFHDRKLIKRVDEAVLPVLTSNNHCHEMCALAITLLEMKQYGKEYGLAVQKNSKRLGEELVKRGVKALYEKLGFSKSHQVLVEVGPNPMKILRRLELGGILCSITLLPWDSDDEPTGIRLGTQVLTRRGMVPDDMEFIAQVISDIIVRDENEHHILVEYVEPFIAQERFKRIRFTFDDNFNQPLNWADLPFVDSVQRATFSKEAVLRTIRPFHGCTADELSVIQRVVHLCKNDGEPMVIAKKGQRAEFIIVLVRGEIERVVVDDNHDINIECFRSRGASLLVDETLQGKEITSAIMARTGSMWVYIPVSSFKWMLQCVPSIQRFYWRFSRDIQIN